MKHIDTLLIINGIYDIVCALSILFPHDNFPAYRFHLDMFHVEMRSSPLFQRMLAYQILVCGMVRLVAGMQREKGLYILAIGTYLIEFGWIEYENVVYHTMNSYRAHVTAVFSIGLAAYVFYARRYLFD
jgi:uncharacterized membrane protein YbaN (DUF454 family)